MVGSRDLGSKGSVFSKGAPPSRRIKDVKEFGVSEKGLVLSEGYASQVVVIKG